MYTYKTTQEIESIKVWMSQYANYYPNSNDLAEAAIEEFEIKCDVYNITPTWLITLAKDACYTAALDQDLDPLEKG